MYKAYILTCISVCTCLYTPVLGVRRLFPTGSVSVLVEGAASDHSYRGVWCTPCACVISSASAALGLYLLSSLACWI